MTLIDLQAIIDVVIPKLGEYELPTFEINHKYIPLFDSYFYYCQNSRLTIATRIIIHCNNDSASVQGLRYSEKFDLTKSEEINRFKQTVRKIYEEMEEAAKDKDNQ